MGLPLVRQPLDVYKTVKLLEKLRASGMELFPLRQNDKRPRDVGFLLHDYSTFDWARHVKSAGNVGVRGRPCDLIVDVDPKNGGEDSLATLMWDCDDDFSRYATTITGSGGRHIYMAKPPEVKLKWHVSGLPGIDFQSLGRYVVAPGSIHPTTGRAYTMKEWVDPIPMAPPGLLAVLHKPEPDRSEVQPGALSNDEIRACLEVLDPREFGTDGKYHDSWLDLAMAVHHASNGSPDAMDIWLQWNARDKRYGNESRELNERRWDSFDGRDNGVTYKTLLRLLSKEGHKGLVSRLGSFIEASEDFDDDELDEDILLLEED